MQTFVMSTVHVTVLGGIEGVHQNVLSEEKCLNVLCT